MKNLFLTIICCLGQTISLFGCMCFPPINDLKTDIDSSDAIFIGVVTKINYGHTFHLNDGYGFGLQYVNFDIVKTNRGINPTQLKITLFDSYSNSSCEGMIGLKSLGDTVLVFADNMNKEMIGSYLCGRHPTFHKLSDEERNFIDTATWIDPRTKHENPDQFLERYFGNNEETTDVKLQSTRDDTLLYVSFGFNLLLLTALFFSVRNRSR